MKVLIGVCGIGNGHSIRQYEIANALSMRGHEVRILTYNEGVNFFKNTKYKIYNVYVPIIMFKGKRIDWKDCIKRNFFKYIPGVYNNKRIFKILIKENFIPDVCISDYEPVVAKFAYKLNKPLLNIDQHSKFIYMKETNINGFSCDEEKRRLQYFFPKYTEKFVVSFYNLSQERLPYNVKIMYPIIRSDLKKEIKKKEESKNVVVYFSKFINISIKQRMEEIFKIFAKFPTYKFIVFSNEYYENYKKEYANIIVKKNDRKRFVEKLCNASSVISTAGHTLISEALYCHIPMFVIPLPTFDQNYCGKFIKDNNIGYSDNKITYENLKEFLEKESYYKKNINTCENLIKPTDTLEYLVKEIEKYDERG